MQFDQYSVYRAAEKRALTVAVTTGTGKTVGNSPLAERQRFRFMLFSNSYTLARCNGGVAPAAGRVVSFGPVLTYRAG
jgi:hypothetical protein